MTAPMYKMKNGQRVQLTESEVAAREKDKRQANEARRQQAAAAAKREQIKAWEMQKAASARAKLRGLLNGLDEEEAFAIIGKYGARIADMVTEKELMSDMTAQEIIAKKINE